MDRISSTREDKLAEINATKQRIVEMESYLKENKKQYLKNIAKKVVWKILLIISIFCVIFFTIGTIAVFPIIIIDIPFIVWMIFMIRLNYRAKKTTQLYESVKQDLANSKIDLSEKETSYSYWLRNNSY